jgi:hypothetical protein
MAIVFKKKTKPSVVIRLSKNPKIDYDTILSEDGCYHLSSPIWTKKVAPIPAGLVNIPEDGIKVKVDWVGVSGMLVFPGTHIISPEEYAQAPEGKNQQHKPARLVDCQDWISV